MGFAIPFLVKKQSCKHEHNEHILHRERSSPAACRQGPHTAERWEWVALKAPVCCRDRQSSSVPYFWGWGPAAPPSHPHPQVNGPAEAEPLEGTGRCRGENTTAIDVKMLTRFTSSHQYSVLHKIIWNCIKYVQWLPKSRCCQYSRAHPLELITSNPLENV